MGKSVTTRQTRVKNILYRIFPSIHGRRFADSSCVSNKNNCCAVTVAMKSLLVALFLSGSVNWGVSFSSFAHYNRGLNINVNKNKAWTKNDPSLSSGKMGWDPSPFQELRGDASSDLDPPLVPLTTNLESDTPLEESLYTNKTFPPQNPQLSTTPVPFGATKAKSGSSDVLFNPLFRPVSFSKENGTLREDDSFSVKVSPPTPTLGADIPATLPLNSVATKPEPNEMTKEKSSKNQIPRQMEPPSGDDREVFILSEDDTITERMLKRVPTTQNQAGGAGGASSLEAFQRAEANWAKLKAFKPFRYDQKLLRWTQDGHGPPPQFVATDGAFGNPKCWEKLRNSIDKEGLDYDVVICGGTLGIFFAMYLQLQGHNVCVVEAGKLRGREQEWNISMDELLELKDLGILTQEDIDAVITTEFAACRSGFKNKEVTPLKGGYFENGVGFECLTPDVLNLGVAPALLLERVSKRFQAIGGVIKDETRLSGVCVSELVGSAIDLGQEQEPITTRLVLDCMGNASPISAQQRYGQKADGICCVVGSCAGGFEAKTNLIGDIIYTNQPIMTKNEKGSNQYFWEAFPVGIGRGKAPGTSDVKTTYSKCRACIG
jgi:hypothetical protein